MAEEKTYTGGCHCGRVRFEVDLAIDKLMACNCSICASRGWLLAFAPAAKFRLLQGENDVTTYRFNKHIIAHRFCATCGTSSYSDGVGHDGALWYSVNARCLDGVDVAAFPVQQWDGRSQ